MRLTHLLLYVLLLAATNNLRAQDALSLDETIQYITNKINGRLPIKMNDQGTVTQTVSVLEFKDNCLVLKSNLQVKVGQQFYAGGTTITYLPLNKLDPNVEVEVFSKPNVSEFYDVSFKTSDGSHDIILKTTYVDHLNPGNNHKTSSTQNNWGVGIQGWDEKLVANSLAKAFRHAIELCGGKSDPFANPTQ